jgi:molybdate transport system permease protein
VKGVLDVVLTLPLVFAAHGMRLVFSVIFGLKHPIGQFLQQYGIQFVMTWYGGILAASVWPFADVSDGTGCIRKF